MNETAQYKKPARPKRKSVYDSKDPIAFIVVRKTDDYKSYNIRIYSEDLRANVEDDFVTGETWLFDQLSKLTKKYVDKDIKIIYEFREE